MAKANSHLAAYGFALLSTVAYAHSQAETLKVQVGDMQAVPMQKLVRVAVADPGIADVHMPKQRDALLVEGRKPGRTTVLLWQQGQTAPTRIQVQVNARATLEPAPGVDWHSNGSRQILDGKIADVAQHSQFVGALGKEVDDRTVLNTGGTVQVDIRVVEFSRNTLAQAGLNLLVKHNGSAFTFGSLVPGATDLANPIASAFNLFARRITSAWDITGALSLLESNGYVQVLAEPSLVALSGQTATFLAGGELPIPVAQTLGSVSIEWKKFGIGLAISPTIINKQRIALKVAPEASELDYNRAILLNGTAVPSVVTRRAETTVELGDGESFVIGGLVSRNLRKNIDKVPGLGDLPILGAFFKRVEDEREDRELMIVVTPHIVSPMAKNAPKPGLPGEGSRIDESIWKLWLVGLGKDRKLTGFSE
ncbi:exported fimbriae assembly protein [Jeongeupia sp. HS-3]|uniref:type II and III secretion system protein family protein n=1 Tax=Jeongeupia sp. HS-3 TaxID=1009682 RepID=UPI0018A4B676|nr:type II and III secretion system protein family protein [Jeongeupia sp. HS-3]BCL77110.1 exported fimbriae assembly protein [Jeongeupia sp. HS-3]